MAAVVEQLQRPALVLAPNKTLAAQLYGEFKEFFPHNAVEYFVSYYDYYQPEAYIPRSDTYIEKDASHQRGDREAAPLRHPLPLRAPGRAHRGLASPASTVSARRRSTAPSWCTSSAGRCGRRDRLLRYLIDIQYERNDASFTRGKFRVRGEVLEIFPAYDDFAIRVEFFGDEVDRIVKIDPLTGEILASAGQRRHLPGQALRHPGGEAGAGRGDHPGGARGAAASGWRSATSSWRRSACSSAPASTWRCCARRAICLGIENYSRHLSGRAPGEPPWTLLDYLPDDFLLFVDESHVAVPQVRGMFAGDRSRKQTLVDYGFRLPSALDNRPLTFEEFETHLNQVVFVSATPGPYELEHSAQRSSSS